MNKFLRMAMLLGLLSLNAQAEEKVWYCEMTALATITIADGAKTFKTQKFKMKVSMTEVIFGSSGYFEGVTKLINFWVNENYWSATDDFSLFVFKDGEVHSVAASPELGVIGLAARCDDF